MKKLSGAALQALRKTKSGGRNGGRRITEGLTPEQAERNRKKREYMKAYRLRSRSDVRHQISPAH
jgi:hypothetical protein